MKRTHQASARFVCGTVWVFYSHSKSGYLCKGGAVFA
nr:MAG TPA: hypothetical protein [Bacteriophage sp.]